MDIDLETIEEPLTATSLSYPYSNEVSLLLQIYSMEMPFSHELINKKQSKFSDHILQTLGPFDRCLQEIINGSCEQKRDDRLDSSPILAESQAFLVYKGCMMHKDKIQRWKDQVGETVHLPSITSFTESFRESIYSLNHLDFIKNKNKDIKPVIFVLSLFNQTSYQGFRLNNEKYSAYPGEQEILMPAGMKVGIEGNDLVKVSNYLTKERQNSLEG